jgi:DNA ligase-1
MRRFTQLYRELDETNRTSTKVAAMEAYFREAPPRDAAWALLILSGEKAAKGIPASGLRRLAVEETGLPRWLVDECCAAVGDLAETVAHLMPGGGAGEPPPLHQLIEERVLPLGMIPETARAGIILRTWRELGPLERYLYNKLITGALRVGVQRTLVERALANVCGVPQPVMAHRLMGEWKPTAAAMEALLSPDADAASTSVARPYPFFLATQVEEPIEATLGDVSQWLAEWKWDGIRAQLIRRAGQAAIWSRGEELVTDRFPEVAEAARALPDGTVLDGELLAWEGDAPRSFADLQHRIGRKAPGQELLAATPVAFVAYDLLEREGGDWRTRPLRERRAALEALLHEADPRLRVSPLVDTSGGWDALRAARSGSRARGVEGLMLKCADSAYGTGRARGAWWKWKVEPYTADCVLVYAQAGHGRRASLYTDYTFAVWDGEELVPVMKAYSGLTDGEIREVDAWIRKHTLARHGPVRTVEPVRVFELAFEGIQESDRHRSGIAVRFPRIARQRPDRLAKDADTLERLRALLKAAR